jgi:hypothetical protein
MLALKDEAIQAKDETIQSLKTSMVVLERANKQMEAEKRLLEDKQNPTMSYTPVGNYPPAGFWQKVKSVFGNS